MGFHKCGVLRAEGIMILIIPAVRNVNISIKKEHPSGWMGVLNVLQQVTDDIPQSQQNNDQR